MIEFFKNLLKANVMERVEYLMSLFLFEEVQKIETEGGRKAFISLLDTEEQLMFQMIEKFNKEVMTQEFMDKIVEEEMQKLMTVFENY